MNSLVHKAAKGFSLLMIVRVFSRIIDFFLNVLVIRKIDPAVYGLTTHLGLLTNFSLFYLKVCLKQAYQRRCESQDNMILISAQNMMKLGGLVTILLTFLISTLIAYLYSPLNEYFVYSCILHGIAAIIEAAAEPLTVRFVLTFNYAIPAQAETVAVFLKTVTLYFLCITAELPPLVAFGYSQIVFSLALLCVQLVHSLPTSSLWELFAPQKINPTSYIQAEMKEMGLQFTFMAFLKFVLQELEKIVIVTFKKNDSSVSAEFSLVSHIGAMVPRFIYSPIEDVSFNLFSKMASDTQFIRVQLDYMKKILIFINTLGIAFLFAGIPLSYAFIDILFGSQWTTSSCVRALQVFCIYEWVMGVNGITESFVNANLSSAEMPNYRRALMSITIIYIMSSLILIELGAAGIIAANIISMICRISISFTIINKKSKDDKLGIIDIIQCLPNIIIWILYIAANLSFRYYQITNHLIQIGVFGIIFSFSILLIIPQIKQLFLKKVENNYK